MTSPDSISRVIQSKKDSCQNACVAMLTGIDEHELIDEYGTPLPTEDMVSILREYYDYVNLHSVNARGMRALAYLAEALIVTVESPLRERDPELYAELLEADREEKVAYCRERYDNPSEEDLEWYRNRAEVHHAFVVYNGEIYDPRDPPYWASLGGVPHIGYEHDYAVQDVLVCTNHETAIPDDGRLPRGESA